MYGEPELWHDLCARLAQIAGAFLRVQAQAGASVVQLFDSWVGALPLADYERYVQPHSATALAAVADLGVPRIHFGVGTGELLPAMGAAGAEVVGVDFRVSLDGRRAASRPGVCGPGQPRPGDAVRALAGRRGAGPPDRHRGAVGARATSSTSATASCRRPTRRC